MRARSQVGWPAIVESIRQPSPSRGRARILLGLAGTLLASGCRRPPAPPGGGAAAADAAANARAPLEQDPAGALLAGLPRDTETVVALDCARFRRARVWQVLRALAGQRPEDRAAIAALTERTGLDPFIQVDHALAAFPRDARVAGAFVLVLDGRDFDERRLIAYARESARARGADLMLSPTADGHVWRRAPEPVPGGAPPGPEERSPDDDVAAFFVGTSRFVIGRAGWAERTQALLAGRAAPPDREVPRADLAHLITRVRAPDAGEAPALWFASLTPEQLRATLQARTDSSGEPAPAIARWGLALFLDPGLRVRVRAELPHARDAEALARRFQAYLRALQGDPRVLLLGLTGYLQQVQVAARGPDVEAHLALDDAQVAALLQRLEQLRGSAPARAAPSAPAARRGAAGSARGPER